MIFGIGVDIVDIHRMKKWVNDEKMLRYVFSERELIDSAHFSEQKRMEYYAARFAAKEAFSKALGTGLAFSTKCVFIAKEKSGAPVLFVEGKAKEILEEKCGKCSVHVSLSHEKSNAVAFVVIEKKED